MTDALRLPCAVLYRYLLVLSLYGLSYGNGPCAIGPPQQYSIWLGSGGELTFPITNRSDNPFDEDLDKHFYNPLEFLDDYLMLHTCPDEDFTIIEDDGYGCTHCKAAKIYSCYGQNQTNITLPENPDHSELCMFRMNFVGVENIQSHTFSGLTIKNIKIQFGGVKHIEPEAFNNVTKLKTLTITQNQIVDLGRPREVFACLPELSVLILDQNQIQTWDSDDTSNDTTPLLPKLEYLSLAGNPLNHLNSSSFSWLGGSPLKYLNLRESKLCISTTTLGRNVLGPVKETLEFLDLGSATMGINALSALLQSLVFDDGSAKLKGLGLSNLGLNQIPGDLHLVKRQLQYLSLHGNSFHALKSLKDDHSSLESNVDAHLFEDRAVSLPHLPELLELDLRDSQIKCIRYGAFEMLPKLQVLMLGRNELSDFEDGSFRSLHRVHYLDLSHNTNYPFSPPLFGYIHQPASLFLGDLTSLKTLDLSFSKVDMLRTEALDGLGHSLVNLSLCYVEMSHMDQGVFRNLTGLEILDLSGNSHITTVFTSELFEGLDNLLELHMADCNLDFPPLTNASSPKSSYSSMDPFLYFTKLKVLNLTHNNFKFISRYSFSSLRSVETIDIGENHILPWTHPILDHNPNLTKLNVRRNRISFMTETMLREFSLLEVLDVSGNPFMCDCYVIPFLNMASNNVTDVTASTSGQTTLIQKIVPFFTFRNVSWDRQLPSAEDEDKWEVLIQTGLSRNIDTILKNNRIYYEEESWSFLDLDEDQQQGMIKRHFLELNISNLVNGSVYVVGLEQDNAYSCLDTQWSRNLEFHDVNSSYCMSKITTTLPPNNKITVYIAIVLILLLLIVAILFALYRKWWYIRYYALQLKNATILSFMGRCNEEEPQPIFQYDVFLSFCDVNREWVLEHLIPNLEGENDLTVCLHERDFQVGVSILENIIASMDRSRCILLVVSLSFIKSRWCQFELHVAQHRLLETRREELVLILLEDIPQSKRPKMLHFLMLTKTYIVWPKDENNNDARKLFWKRLKKAVTPSRNTMVSVA